MVGKPGKEVEKKSKAEKKEAPEKQEGLTPAYEKGILETAAARDRVTRDLLRGLVKKNPDEFIMTICRLAKPPIKKPEQGPDGKLQLCQAVLAIQKYVGMLDIDNEKNRDGKFGPITLDAVFKKPEFESLKAHIEKRQAIIEGDKKKLETLDGQAKQNPQAQASMASSQLQGNPGWDIDRSKLDSNKVRTIGDSLTWFNPKNRYGGYAYYLKINNVRPTSGSDFKFAKGGKNVRSMRQDLESEEKKGNLKTLEAAVIFGGTNDVGFRKVEDIKNDLGKIVQILKDNNPNMKIVLVTLAPGRNKKVHERVLAVNAWIRGQRGGNIAVIDLYKEFEDPNKPGEMAKKYNGGDNIHFSGKGYKALAKAVEETIYTGKYRSFGDYT